MNPALRDIIEQSASATAFSPADITGLALWLDASDAATLTLDGSNNVSQWNDKSGNGNHGAQSTTTARPSITGSINGRSALAFDGIDDSFSVANSATIDLGPTMSVFIVHKLSSASSAARQTLIQFSNGSTASPSIEAAGTLPPSGGNANSYVLIRPGVVIATSAANSLTTSGVVSSFHIENSANCSIRINSTEVAFAASAGMTLTGSGSAKLIGMRGSPAQNYSGAMGEIIVFNKRLSAEETTQIESYLISKWGIT